MYTERYDEIREEARALLNESFASSGCGPESLRDFLIDAPELICREILKVRCERVPGLSYQASPGALPERIGGYVNRAKNIIQIEAHEPFTRQRFTLAHEIGHWVLHPDGEHFRDSVIHKLNHKDPRRPLEEREADAFAAELLMPRKAVVKEFNRRFSGVDENLIFAFEFWHRVPQIHAKCSIEEFTASSYRRALVLAGLTHLESHSFSDLATVFSVSKSAMALRLRELNLVL